MAADISPYLALITSEHRNRPNFIAALSAIIQPAADITALIKLFPALYDIDVAIGKQLDAVGQWVGRTRFLEIPLNVYFSFGIAGLGFGQGVFWQPHDPLTGITELDDTNYRILLKAKIIANNWDGTIPGAYAAYAALFANFEIIILIQDYGNMTMAIALTGHEPNAVIQALFTSGELSLKPAGVRLSHVLPSDFSKPMFGFGLDNATIGGFGHGAFAKFFGEE